MLASRLDSIVSYRSDVNKERTLKLDSTTRTAILDVPLNGACVVSRILAAVSPLISSYWQLLRKEILFFFNKFRRRYRKSTIFSLLISFAYFTINFYF